MINDLKSYIQTVIGRLEGAFRVEDFSLEEETEFWNIATEYLSQNRPSNFDNIVRWVDSIYRAPVHIVYQLQNGNKLRLLHRHILTENKKSNKKARVLSRQEAIKNAHKINTEDQKLSLFEQQINNIERQIEYRDDFKKFGKINLSIGECERLPLYDGNDLWGIYCTGPFVTHPLRLDAKISIIARTLAKLIIDSEGQERQEINHFENETKEYVDSFGLGSLDIPKISRFFIQYLVNFYSAAGGVVLEFRDNKLMVLAKHLLSNKVVYKISEAYRFDDEMNMIPDPKSEKELNETLKNNGILSFRITPFSFNEKNGFIFLGFKTEQIDYNDELKNLIQILSVTFGNLIDFKDRNDHISAEIIDTFYELIRGIEKSKKDTYYHSSRIIAFAEKFSQTLGLDDEDQKTLMLTAKLHDVGYVGAIEVNESTSLGTELRHPVIGELLVKMLPINPEVKSGIRTHHEWVNGSGTPNGLTGDDISWTGKIVGIIEYIVEYLEKNQNSELSGEELHEKLVKHLMERTDQQFDMVLVPITINMLKTFNWEELIELGTL